MLISLFAICAGASIGACMRWLLNLALNPVFATLPLGTLAANWLGSLLMGLAIAFFDSHPGLAPQWKLLAITGFLGSFTTFSAFAGEMHNLIAANRPGLCAAGICLHVFGSILLVFAGIWLASWLKRMG